MAEDDDDCAAAAVVVAGLLVMEMLSALLRLIVVVHASQLPTPIRRRKAHAVEITAALLFVETAITVIIID